MEVSPHHPLTCAQPATKTFIYPKRPWDEMGNGEGRNYPKRPWDEMGNEMLGDAGLYAFKSKNQRLYQNCHIKEKR